MKRIILMTLSVLMILISLGGTPVRANAEELPRYAVAAGRDVLFYREKDEDSALFYVPFSYYVKVLEEGEMCKVSYLADDPPYRKVTGYCKREKLTFVDFVPERPYLQKQIRVEYRLPLPNTALGNGSFATVAQTFVYYGLKYAEGDLYYYVLKDGTFDYIPGEEEPEYPVNTDYLPKPDEEVPSPAVTPLQIVLIVLCCLIVVAVAIFLVRGKKSSVKDPFDEQAEF